MKNLVVIVSSLAALLLSATALAKEAAHAPAAHAPEAAASVPATAGDIGGTMVIVLLGVAALVWLAPIAKAQIMALRH